jgi:maltose O-acetyltransferase
MGALADLRRRARGLDLTDAPTAPPDAGAPGWDPADRSVPSGGWSVRVNVWSMWSWWSPGHRAAWLRLCGLHLGTGTLVQPCHIGSPRLRVGARSYIGVGCVFDGRAPITIGSDVALGDQTMLVTSSHDHADPRHRAGTASGRPVRIDDGCWLGVRVTVLPGVHVGAGCVLAAGAVVVRDCEPHGLYAGVPARRVRDLPTGP